VHSLSIKATVAALAMLLAATVAAQSSDDELAAKATDPTASLMSFQLADWYQARFRDVDGTANQLVLRAAIPWEGFGRPNIFRVTLPLFTHSPSGRTGISDTTVFNLTVFNESWGRWGVGIDGTLPTGRDGLTTDQWTIGPAFGFVNSSTKQFNWGLFTQTFFSFAGSDSAPDVRIVNVQPIASYQLGGGRSVSLGNSALVYDVERSRWSSVMFGLNYGQVVTWGGHKWRPNVEVDYDFRNLHGNQEWVVRAAIVLLLPR
jgi:hypothetical protein